MKIKSITKTPKTKIRTGYRDRGVQLAPAHRIAQVDQTGGSHKSDRTEMT